MARRPSVCIPIFRKSRPCTPPDKLAFLANVGPLNAAGHAGAISGQQFARPRQSFFACRSATTSGRSLELDGFYKTGWAGRLADNLGALNTSSTFPPITSVAGSAIFCTGQQTQPYAIIPGTTPGLSGFDSSASATARSAGLAAIADLRYRRFADSSRQLHHFKFAGRQQDSFQRADFAHAVGYRLPANQHRRPVEASGAASVGALRAQLEPPGFLLFPRRFRHAQQPDRYAANPVSRSSVPR